MTTALSSTSEQAPSGYTQATNGSSSYSHTNGHAQPMDARQSEYPQSGLSTPSTKKQNGTQSDQADSIAEQASTAQYNQQGQDVKLLPPTPATPSSDYGRADSTRPASLQDFTQRSQNPDAAARGYRPFSGAAGNSGGAMAQSSPSMSQNNGRMNDHDATNNTSSNSEVPIDPSIATSSPSYPHNYSPYPQPDMHYPNMYGRQEQHPYQNQYPPGMSGHHPYGMSPPMGQHPGMPAGAGSRPPAGGHPLSTVYSFVPIPGTHQHKRPRRRYEEIERMYKCGWNGCEKAYGTLNHLNAHVTMQSHGQKRTPEEFKEIRKEWKARKKEEDIARKQAEERDRTQGGPGGPGEGQQQTDGAQSAPGGYPHPSGGVRQLPPLGYVPAGGPVAPPYGQSGPGMEGMPQYGNNQMYSNYPPHSPYGQSSQI